MTFTHNQILADLRLLALKAVANVEHQARVFLATEGIKWTSEDKQKMAVNLVMEGYKVMTANIPILSGSQVDDVLVKKWCTQAVNWACNEVCDLINSLGRTPVTGAPELGARKTQ